MKRWYVVQTQPRREEKALLHLRNQNFHAYLPRYRKTRRHARRVEKVLRPLFPGYLFVELDRDSQAWRPINGTVGVARLVARGNEPQPVPEGIVDEILAREGDGGAVTLAPRTFEKGQKLRLTHGAMAEQVGLFEEMADDQRVVLLLDLLGREVRVTAPVEALEAASQG